MNEELQELYQAIILDHNKHPRNYRPMRNSSHAADGHNPLCGDELSVFLRVEGDKITDASFQGEGCAISRASASLMTSLIKGRTVPEARREFSRAIEMLTGREQAADFEESGEIAALAGVRLFPVRVKCATLAWHALNAALDGRRSASTE